ncbi:MAG: 50S ribosomal protein L10 [Actinomycetota bacterium]|nr:50S ribosomal protein L10 [Actinomycetota bacterium]
MPRPEKVLAVEEIKERLGATAAIFLTEYRGLSVTEQQALRRHLHRAETEYKVVKMSLARRAAEELDLEELIELLRGPTALAFADRDPAVAAKALRDFGRDHAQLLIKGGLLRGQVLAAGKVAELADLEPREVLLGRVAGAVQAPMGKAAALMAALGRNTATVLQQLLEKKSEENPHAREEKEE